MPSKPASTFVTTADLGDAALPVAMPPLPLIFGRSKSMRQIRHTIEAAARTSLPILIQGESGTGKEVCAQLIHLASPRQGRPFVKVNCAAIPSALLESELFGYEKGAFTGATAAKAGRIEKAHRGTLLLDEIGSLDLHVQPKLLHFLQDGNFMRVGGEVIKNTAVRIVCTAHQDIRRQASEGSFRLDLLHRINAVTLSLPPLRERSEDIPDLIAYFSQLHAASLQVPPRHLPPGLLQLLKSYHWPGNIRQLDNLIRTYVLLGDEDLVLAALLSGSERSNQILSVLDLSQPCSLREITATATRHLETDILLTVLRLNGWNKRKTAKWLKMSYRSLLYKLKDIPAHTQTTTADQQPSTSLHSNTVGLV